MFKPAVVRVFAVMVLALVLAARVEAAPLGGPAGLWQWVAGFWPGQLAASRLERGREARPRTKAPGSRKAGGCADPDGLILPHSSSTGSLCDSLGVSSSGS